MLWSSHKWLELELKHWLPSLLAEVHLNIKTWCSCSFPAITPTSNEQEKKITLNYGFRVTFGCSKLQQHQPQTLDEANWQVHHAKAELCSPKGWESTCQKASNSGRQDPSLDAFKYIYTLSLNLQESWTCALKCSYFFNTQTILF